MDNKEHKHLHDDAQAYKVLKVIHKMLLRFVLVVDDELKKIEEANK